MRRLPEAAYRAALFALPFAAAFLYAVSMLPMMSVEQWQTVIFGMGAYLLAPVGTEIVVPVLVITLRALDASLAVQVLGIVSVVLVDVFTAWFIAWNWDLLERTPYLGAGLRRVEEKCRAIIARRKWGERATLVALATYVALPFQMTGGLFGSVLGRVMGLDRTRVFLAIVAGSLAGAVPVGAFAILVAPGVLDAFVAAFSSRQAQLVGLVAGILITFAFVAVTIILYRRGRRAANAE